MSFSGSGWPPAWLSQLSQQAMRPAARSEMLDKAINSQMDTALQNAMGTPSSKPTLASLFADPTIRLSPEDTLLFLRDSLRLPQQARVAMLMMALEASPEDWFNAPGEKGQPMTPENVKTLVKQTLAQLINGNDGPITVDAAELQQLLGEKTQAAQQKLGKLLQGNLGGQMAGASQVAEVMVTLGKLQESIKTSPARALETFMLMYLPWHPNAVAPQYRQPEWDVGDGEGGGALADISLTLYLDTNTLGRFKIVLVEQDSLRIQASVSCETMAEPFLPELKTAFNDILAKEGLPAATVTTDRIAPKPILQTAEDAPALPIEPGNLARHAQADGGSFRGATRLEDRRQIHIQSGKRISLLVLNSAYALARFLFEADDRNRLTQKKGNSGRL